MKVSINIASHRKRGDYLRQTVDWLLKQSDDFDVINVYLNDYRRVPAFLNHPKVNSVLAPIGDLKASGKFYFLQNFDGVYITCDDDLRYSDSYVKNIKEALKSYEYKIAVGYHGTIYSSLPVKSYYHSQKTKFHFSSELKRECWVDMLGTGTMGIHSSLGVSMDLFKYPNMCDPQIMKFFIENKIPQLCLPRKQFFIKEHIGSQNGYCIWKECAHKGDKKQTEIVNSIKNYEILKA